MRICKVLSSGVESFDSDIGYSVLSVYQSGAIYRGTRQSTTKLLAIASCSTEWVYGRLGRVLR